MDGFGSNEGVIVLAATNRPDVLDSALLRAGRFDRQIVVSMPDAKAREEILKVHSKNKKLSEDISLEVVAKNTAGIGARILALFNRRGFNVTKMTSGITNTPGYARITLTVEADDRILDQIQKQIYKLIDVVKVKVFEDHDVVCRELMLIKVKATAATRSQIVQIADVYRGNVLDISPTSMIIEVIGSVEKLRGFIQIMETYGVLEIAKTGITAMSRGEKI